MFSTGFSMATDRVAETADGPSVQFLAEQARAARRVGLRIDSRAARAARDRPFNQLVLAAPDGAMHRYAKIHPFGYGAEHEHYAAGDAFLTVDVEGVRCSFFVCYDLRFADEFWPLAPDTDCYVVAGQLAAVDDARTGRRCCARARSRTRRTSSASTGSATGGGLTYAGDSVIIDPLGDVVADAGDAECVVTADVDPARVARAHTVSVPRRPADWARTRRQLPSGRRCENVFYRRRCTPIAKGRP